MMTLFPSIRPAICGASPRAWLLIGALTLGGSTAGAQARDPEPPVREGPIPFRVGEELVYRAEFAHMSAGTARMSVVGIDTVRGHPAYHFVFTLDGGVIGFRVHDRYESWIDTTSLLSLRHYQQVNEGRYHRTTTYEIYPELAKYTRNGDSLHAGVKEPLDDGSFVYAVRLENVQPGMTLSYNRYFDASKNPVTITGIRRDTVDVGAGRFPSVQVHPTIKTNGIFSDHGDAEVWFSDDAHRYPVQLKAKFAIFHLTLTLDSVKLLPEAVQTGAPR